MHIKFCVKHSCSRPLEIIRNVSPVCVPVRTYTFSFLNGDASIIAFFRRRACFNIGSVGRIYMVKW